MESRAVSPTQRGFVSVRELRPHFGDAAAAPGPTRAEALVVAAPTAVSSAPIIWSMLRISVFLLAVCAYGADADLVLHNGKIVTVDSRFSIAQAGAREGGGITAGGG